MLYSAFHRLDVIILNVNYSLCELLLLLMGVCVCQMRCLVLGQIGLFKNNTPVCKALSLPVLATRSPTRARTTRTVRWTLALRPAETN